VDQAILLQLPLPEEDAGEELFERVPQYGVQLNARSVEHAPLRPSRAQAPVEVNGRVLVRERAAPRPTSPWQLVVREQLHGLRAVPPENVRGGA
jgi:hypothetical protein